MTTTKFKITDIPHPCCVKTVTDDLTTRKRVQCLKVKLRKFESLSLNLISGILIIFCSSIAGCTDMPHTGAMLTTDNVDVDQYMVSSNEELVCLQNGTGSECLTLVPKETEKPDSINRPIIHVHPEKLVYIFHDKGKEIVRAERVTDTTEIIETLRETKEDSAPQTGDPSGGTTVRDTDDTQPRTPLQTANLHDDNTNDDSNNQNTNDDSNNQNTGNDNDNGDDTQSSDLPSQQTGNPPNSGTQPRNAPPPPPQTTNLGDGNSNQNVGGNDEPDSTVHHQTPNAMYYDSSGGWYVTIYYPDNYIGPRELPDNFGFTITSSNGTIGTKELTSNGVRILIIVGTGTLYVNVVWNRDQNRWEGDPPSQHYLLQARPGGTHRIMIDMK